MMNMSDGTDLKKSGVKDAIAIKVQEKRFSMPDKNNNRVQEKKISMPDKNNNDDKNKEIKVVKRNGKYANFDKKKIEIAVIEAFKSVKLEPIGVPSKVSDKVEEKLRSNMISNEVEGKLELNIVSNKTKEKLESNKISNKVEEKSKLDNNNFVSVETIQDLVETVLIEFNYPQVAKSYILYRAFRSEEREKNTKLVNVCKEIFFKDSKASNMKRENANIDGDTAMGAMLKLASETSKMFSERYSLPKDISDAHTNGDIHIHDLDFYQLTTTCTQIDLINLFKSGFSTGHGKLREPSCIATYSALACIAIQSNQNDQHGGQSIPNFDYALAIGVRKSFIRHYRNNLTKSIEIMLEKKIDIKKIQDEILNSEINFSMDDNEKYIDLEKKYLLKEICCSDNFISKDDFENKIVKCQKFALRNAFSDTNRETYQAMEALVHNLNTMHSRAGAQTPFSSINYGTDTSSEGRLIIKNVLLALDAGLGDGEMPMFPIHIFRVKRGINFNLEDKNYDLFKLACKVSAKRLFPNFSFQDAPFNLKYYKPGHPETEISYMGCRTRVIANNFDKSKEISYGRGNLSFTSINLPRLGINAHKDINKFFKDLDVMIDLCEKQLLHRFKIISQKKVKNFPFLMGEGVWLDSEKLNKEDSVEKVLKHGTLTVGFIGLAECLIALTGKHHGESAAAQELGLKIISHMREKTDLMSKKHKLNFSLIATPAEGLAGTFVVIDQKKYGIIPGVTSKKYYTNSFHVPVYYEISAFEKIKIEAPYHELTNGGHITYIELDGDTSKNVEVFEKIIRYMEKCNIGYGAINHPVDRDTICGYSGVIENVCPKCGRDETIYPFERIRRITGYTVGSLERFNDAKLAEVKDRVRHKWN